MPNSSRNSRNSQMKDPKNMTTSYFLRMHGLQGEGSFLFLPKFGKTSVFGQHRTWRVAYLQCPTCQPWPYQTCQVCCINQTRLRAPKDEEDAFMLFLSCTENPAPPPLDCSVECWSCLHCLFQSVRISDGISCALCLNMAVQQKLTVIEAIPSEPYNLRCLLALLSFGLHWKFP